VHASLRLTSRSHLACHAYEDTAPIVSLTDEHVSIALTVPDPDQVTPEDVDVARSLAAVVARYITELEHRIAVQDHAPAGDVAA
jgi:pterin-4a-carbinolamine dehydratase